MRPPHLKLSQAKPHIWQSQQGAHGHIWHAGGLERAVLACHEPADGRVLCAPIPRAHGVLLAVKYLAEKVETRQQQRRKRRRRLPAAGGRQRIRVVRDDQRRPAPLPPARPGCAVEEEVRLDDRGRDTVHFARPGLAASEQAGEGGRLPLALALRAHPHSLARCPSLPLSLAMRAWARFEWLRGVASPSPTPPLGCRLPMARESQGRPPGCLHALFHVLRAPS